MRAGGVAADRPVDDLARVERERSSPPMLRTAGYRLSGRPQVTSDVISNRSLRIRSLAPRVRQGPPIRSVRNLTSGSTLPGGLSRLNATRPDDLRIGTLSTIGSRSFSLTRAPAGTWLQRSLN